MDGSRGPQNPGSTIFRKKKRPNFLKFIETVTPLWVLYPSEIMRVGFTTPLLARAVFTRSNKVPGWQPVAPNFREHEFPKKNPDFFLKFIEPVTPLWVLYPSEIMHMVCPEPLLARAVFVRSIKMLGWQPGAPKSREHSFPKKRPISLKFIEPVTPLWVLYPSEIMHLVSTETLLARAVFARLNRVLGWQPGTPKPREHDFPKKRPISLKFIGPATPLWVLYPSKIMRVGSPEPPLARVEFTRSIRELGWQPGAPKLREHDFPKKNVLFL